MSRNDWESGTLKLPTAAWAAFKKGLQEGVKQMYQHDYELMLKLHAALTEQKKGKRGFVLNEALSVEFRKSTKRVWDDVPVYDFKILEFYEVRRLLLGDHPYIKLQKPQKKDLPVINGKTLTFSQGELSIELDNTARTVSYHSGENNHAVERAQESGLGKLFFQLIGKVKWTRGTGGTLTGNDEYNQESRHEGSGANYVTHRFGPLGEPAPLNIKIPRTRKSKPAGSSRTTVVVPGKATVHFRK